MNHFCGSSSSWDIPRVGGQEKNKMETAILNFGRAYLYAIGGKTNRKIKWLWPYLDRVWDVIILSVSDSVEEIFTELRNDSRLTRLILTHHCVRLPWTSLKNNTINNLNQCSLAIQSIVLLLLVSVTGVILLVYAAPCLLLSEQTDVWTWIWAWRSSGEISM